MSFINFIQNHWSKVSQRLDLNHEIPVQCRLLCALCRPATTSKMHISLQRALAAALCTEQHAATFGFFPIVLAVACPALPGDAVNTVSPLTFVVLLKFAITTAIFRSADVRVAFVGQSGPRLALDPTFGAGLPHCCLWMKKRILFGSKSCSQSCFLTLLMDSQCTLSLTI